MYSANAGIDSFKSQAKAQMYKVVPVSLPRYQLMLFCGCNLTLFVAVSLGIFPAQYLLISAANHVFGLFVFANGFCFQIWEFGCLVFTIAL